MPDHGVERIWAHARATLAGEAGPRDPSEVALDQAVLHVLGAGREAAHRVLLRPEATPAALSDDELAFFGEHGYVVLREAVGAGLRDELAGAVPRRLDGRTQGIMVQLFDHPAQRAIRELPRIHKAFAQLWGTADLIATTDRCGFNPPERDGAPFPGPHLHLDLRSLEPPIPFGLAGLIYLTDTPAEQGAFQCVPGFHRRIDREPPATRDLSGMEGQPIPGAAGDMVIWHHALPHGATPNRGERPRIVQYLKYYPPPGSPTATNRAPA